MQLTEENVLLKSEIKVDSCIYLSSYVPGTELDTGDMGEQQWPSLCLQGA